MPKEPHKIEKVVTIPRPPVVAVLGHVDHGKSTLLDYIRKTKVVEKEVGGITQRLGAYEVTVSQIDADTKSADGRGLKPRISADTKTRINADDKTQMRVDESWRESARTITFLDTPGHEAFRGIRERGTTAADIAILVISGEEGVKPQTSEALSYIEAAKIPYIVAITKIDKPNANAERVAQGLAEHKIFVEGYGGDVPCVRLSGKTGEGIAELLEMILLVADLHPIAAHPEKSASGLVIEAQCGERTGIAATLLIKDGTLRKGAFVFAERALAPVRFIRTAGGARESEASAGHAVCVTGWNIVPRIGARFTTFAAKKDAEKQIAALSEMVSRRKGTQKAGATAESKILIPVIIKADAAGSVEAVEHEIKRQETEQVALQIVAKRVGALSESDLKFAVSCHAPLIVGFNVGIDASAKTAFLRSGISFASFDVIYKLAEWVAAKVAERTPKVRVEEISGTARVLKLFSAEKDKQIIGGKVLEGELRRGNEFRVLRRDTLVGTGKIRELQCQKGKIDSAPKDSECGASVSATVTIAVGDRIEAFSIVEK